MKPSDLPKPIYERYAFIGPDVHIENECHSLNHPNARIFWMLEVLGYLYGGIEIESEAGMPELSHR